MERKVYRIRGFDCAACAEKSERHLCEHPEVSSARIDMVGERLYLVSERPFDEDEIKKIIAEVEEDEITLSSLEDHTKEGVDWKLFALLMRIAYCVAVFLLCGFLFKDLYWVRFSLYLSALVVIEYDIAIKVFKNIVKRRNPLDEYLLMFLASTGAFVLASVKYHETGSATAIGNEVFMMEEHFEAVLVCLLWQVGEVFQSIAVRQSTKAIVKAVDSRVEEANLVNEQGVMKVAAKSLAIGDEVLVGIGDKIPVDGEVIEGQGAVDASSLSGESLPTNVTTGSLVYSGTVLVSGHLRVKAKADYASSSAAKVMELVSSSLERKGKAEKFVTRFARFYTPIIFAIALLYLVIAGFVTNNWHDSVFTGLEIMVISCPCAIVISIPLAYFASVGLASKNGIVIKGASFIDALGQIKTVVTDKTGTLTKGKFTIVREKVEEGVDAKEFASLMLSLESSSSHPLAKAIATYYSFSPQVELADRRTDPGLGVEAVYQGDKVATGGASLMERLGVEIPVLPGIVIYLCKGGKCLGYVELEDELKKSTKDFVKTLQNRGISVAMLSGDRPENVAIFAAKTGLNAAEGGLLPADKLKRVEAMKNDGVLAYVGDGINDAPCLASADIGVAMGALGADVAIEEADVILLRDDPMGLVKAMRISSLCRHVMVFNLVFALAVKFLTLGLAVFFHGAMPMEIAVIADTGVAVLLTLNSLLLLCRKL